MLIHIEVQAQWVGDFSERVFRYFYRLRDKLDPPLTCFVVLADGNPNWRPDSYDYEFEGTRLHFSYPTVKLLDFRERIPELEQSENSFALIVLAHLQSQAVKESEDRLAWKRRITQNLLQRELDEIRRWKVLRLVDWLLDLPLELDQIYWDEIREWKGRKIMPFVTGLERIVRDEGQREGLLVRTGTFPRPQIRRGGKVVLHRVKDGSRHLQTACGKSSHSEC